MRVDLRDILDGIGFFAKLILGRKKMRKIQDVLDKLDDAMGKLESFKELRDKVEAYVSKNPPAGGPLNLKRSEANDLNELLQAIDKVGDKLEEVFKKKLQKR